jgi:hypothetical protein
MATNQLNLDQSTPSQSQFFPLRCLRGKLFEENVTIKTWIKDAGFDYLRHTGISIALHYKASPSPLGFVCSLSTRSINIATIL